MDFIKLAPSPTLLSVLEELKNCPGSPKRIRDFFAGKSSLPLAKCKGSPTKWLGKLNVTKKEESVNKEEPVEKDEKPKPAPELLLLTADVKWCHAKLRERGMPYRINDLINESKIIFPPYEPPLRSPELEARIQKLRTMHEQQVYRRMVRNISGKIVTGNSFSTVGHELREMHKEVNRHLITGLQYLISVVGTFFALFVGLGFATSEFGPRLIIGIVGALIVGVAEIYFIIRQDIREEARVKIE